MISYILSIIFSFLIFCYLSYMYCINQSNSYIKYHNINDSVILNHTQSEPNLVIMLNGWRVIDNEIYKEFLNAINSTELIDKAIKYSFVIDDELGDILINEYHFNKIYKFNSLIERDVEDRIFNYCKYHQNNTFILYIHFKGSYHNTKQNIELRKMLIYYLILNYDKCIDKLKNNVDVCGSRFSFLPYRHYSGNMWWSKCSYISTLKMPDKLITNGFRYRDVIPGFQNDRYSSEKWIFSNPEAIPIDLMNCNIDYSYDYGNDDLYKIWNKLQDNYQSPNLQTLNNLINYHEINIYPSVFFTLFTHLIYDYEIYYDSDNKMNNIGWCKSLLNNNSTNIDNINVNTYKVLDYCLLSKYLSTTQYDNVDNKNNNHELTDESISVFIHDCNNIESNYNNSIFDMGYSIKQYCFTNHKKFRINNKWNIIYNKKNNEIYELMYNKCKLSSDYIIYVNNITTAIELINKLDNNIEFIGKYSLNPFIHLNDNWLLSCSIIESNNILYYSYNGPQLHYSYEYYGINEYSYKRWFNFNQYKSVNCNSLTYDNIEDISYNTLINTLFDIKSNKLNSENIHYCQSWCECIKDQFTINKELSYYCNNCIKIIN